LLIGATKLQIFSYLMDILCKWHCFFDPFLGLSFVYK